MMDVTALVTRLSPPLNFYCRARTHCPFLAEETAQDALTALVQRCARDDPPENPEAFVFTIARRRLRRRRWWQRARLPLDAAREATATDADPELRSVQRDDARRLMAAVGRLQPAEREALMLIAVHGLDAASGARRLGITASAFRMRTHRARRRLAVWLGALALAGVCVWAASRPVDRGLPTAIGPVSRELVGSGPTVAVRPVPPAGSILMISASRQPTGDLP